MNFLFSLGYFILILLKISITLFILIIITYHLWNWLVNKEIEERRIIENARM